MLHAICAAILFALIGIDTAQAATLHRLPLAYVPYNINAWKDASATTGVDVRYDNITIPSGSFYYDGHRGTDFAAPYGTTVYASARGTVYSTNNVCAPNGGYLGNPCGSGFGRFVAIKHADNMVSIYAHLSSVSVFSGSITCISGPGGKTVGVSGNSGSSSGAHLHFELRINDLSGTSMSYDPFGGTASTQTWDYWYDWAWVSDPLRPGFNMHYPVTTCQP